ncbi:alpha/beta hydrolase [Streptomyces sp. NPDC059355]|uniref:alpha/beta hydrolase n=1 Tax=Streptomyces sp. NPDC059355 TaxID=3346811 RepID=UPI0036A2426B
MHHRITRHAAAVLAALVLLLQTAGIGAAGAAEAADDPAQVVEERLIDARTLDLTVSSPEIDTPVKVRLLLPPAWSKTATRTWPVLWLLHGGPGDHTDWTANTHVQELAAPRDVLVVLPQTSPCSGYSDWYNTGSGGPPAWETYLLDELRPLLESGYRAGTERAVAGLSMGGLGAMKLAAAHPGTFRAVASYSGAVSTLHLSLDGGLSGPDLVKGAGAGATPTGGASGASPASRTTPRTRRTCASAACGSATTRSIRPPGWPVPRSTSRTATARTPVRAGSGATRRRARRAARTRSATARNASSGSSTA